MPIEIIGRKGGREGEQRKYYPWLAHHLAPHLELAKDGERLCCLRESCGFGLTEERFGLLEVVALGSENGTGMEGGGRGARLAEIGLGFAQAVFAEGDVGAVEVGLRRVGEHAHGNLEDFVKFRGTRFVGLRHEVELVERELLGLGAEESLGFFNGEGANGIVHTIVGMAERGIPVAEHIGIVLGIERLDAGFLGVGLEVGIDEGEDFRTMADAGRVGHVAAKAVPVLRRGLDGEDGRGEFHEATHIVAESGGTAIGEARVVVIGTLGRGVAVDGDVGDGRVRVVLDEEDGLEDLLEFTRVLAIGGMDFRTAHGEVEEGRAIEGIAFDGGLRADKGEGPFGVDDRDGLAGGGTEIRPSAAAGVIDETDTCSFHPGGEGDGGAIVELLLCAVATGEFRFTGGTAEALIENMALTTVDHDGGEGPGAVAFLDDGGDDDALAFADMEPGEVHRESEVDFVVHLFGRVLREVHGLLHGFSFTSALGGSGEGERRSEECT